MAQSVFFAARLIALGLAALLSFSKVALATDCAVFDTLDRFAATAIPAPGATCSTFVTEAATIGTSCHWSHAYRGSTVAPHAARIWQHLTSCRAGQLLAPDTQVNHPDSYDLREWAHGRDVYALSVKDKAALERTFVFLRIEPSRLSQSD